MGCILAIFLDVIAASLPSLVSMSLPPLPLLAPFEIIWGFLQGSPAPLQLIYYEVFTSFLYKTDSISLIIR